MRTPPVPSASPKPTTGSPPPVKSVSTQVTPTPAASPSPKPHAGTCPGDGRCNVTGGVDVCNGCLTFNNAHPTTRSTTEGDAVDSHVKDDPPPQNPTPTPTFAPNGAGGASGSGGKTTVGLKRTETVGKFNDDEAEKRLRRKSAKLLGQQPTMSNGLTDPGPGVNALNTGKQPVQLDSIVPAAPIINVPRDVMNSNFEEWMKMATDNVSFRCFIMRFTVHSASFKSTD
jgi:hypothetical protein